MVWIVLCASIVFVGLPLIYYGGIAVSNLRLKTSAPIHYHLLQQEYDVTQDLVPLFFQEGTSKAEVLSVLSEQKYVFRDIPPYVRHSRETRYWGFFSCSTRVWVEYDLDDNLTSIKGSTSACYM